LVQLVQFWLVGWLVVSAHCVGLFATMNSSNILTSSNGCMANCQSGRGSPRARRFTFCNGLVHCTRGCYDTAHACTANMVLYDAPLLRNAFCAPPPA